MAFALSSSTESAHMPSSSQSLSSTYLVIFFAFALILLIRLIQHLFIFPIVCVLEWYTIGDDLRFLINPKDYVWFCFLYLFLNRNFRKFWFPISCHYFKPSIWFFGFWERLNIELNQIEGLVLINWKSIKFNSISRSHLVFPHLAKVWTEVYSVWSLIRRLSLIESFIQPGPIRSGPTLDQWTP